MNLHSMLREREAEGRPVRVGLIGAGKFGSMYLAQVLHTPGTHLLGVADLAEERARGALSRTGWPKERFAARSLADALNTGQTFVTDDSAALIAADGLDVVVEATGNPAAGIRHALTCIEHGRHIVMVNVEADVLAGPLLAEKARSAGTIYSMAYGDQPALICELVDWARACGYEVMCAGKGMNFEPHFRYSTPQTVWNYFGFTEEQVRTGHLNPQMFNSFVDGTKAAIEMAAVANGTGLTCMPQGLDFPPCGLHDLAQTMKPKSEGGRLAHGGTVEIAASQEPDGREVFNNIRFGVFVTFKAPDEYSRECFAQYGLMTDRSGWYGSLWRPFHLIGMETGISVAYAALRAEPTGTPQTWRGDVAATAKRDLEPGETLDGEGGYLLWGRLVRASDSSTAGMLPIGLAHGVRLKNRVAKDQPVRWADVDIDESHEAVRVRREMERRFGEEATAA